MSQPDMQAEEKQPADKMQASLQAKAAARAFVKSKSSAAFMTIREVAEEMGVQQHVLRFWETKFAQIKPLKRGGGRRYYRPDDVTLLKNIQHLLYTEGYTIKGVQKFLRSEGRKALTESLLSEAAEKNAAAPQEASPEPQPAPSYSQEDALRAMLAELKALRAFVVSR